MERLVLFGPNVGFGLMDYGCSAVMVVIIATGEESHGYIAGHVMRPGNDAHKRAHINISS